jgi:Site-specific recombinases, DNA invertase Pin homologs
LSIPAQLEAIRNYCKQKGWKLAHEYIDAGKSAKTDERPEFQRMIAVAKRPNRGFDYIIVHKFDRFSHNRDDHIIYKSLLKKIGITVVSVSEQTDPETPHGFLVEGMLEVISEFYNMNLRNETMKGMRENAKRGFHNGGNTPYGYRTARIKDSTGKDKSGWILGLDDEVNTIRLIYDLYVRKNKGYKAIVNELNAGNIPSPNRKLWSWTTIWHILHNEAYIGQKIWNKHDYSTGKKIKQKEEWIISAGSHPPIVDRDTFNAVRMKSEERNPTGSAYKASGPSIYILRGILKCPMCGVNLITGSNSKCSRGKTRYYQCGTYHRKGSKACKRNHVENPIFRNRLTVFVMES